MKKKTNLFLCGLALVLSGLLMPAQGSTVQKKAKCPGKVSVLLETVKPVNYSEYRYLSGQAQPEVVAVVSPVAGTVSEIKVGEGSLVDAGRELAVLNAGLVNKLKALEQETAKKKKILTVRRNWKVKNEKAVQAAEKDYQAALALLEENRAMVNRSIQAPLAGIVRIKTASAAEVAKGTLLFEIVDPQHLRVFAALSADEAAFFNVGEKLMGVAEGVSGVLEAEIVAKGESQVSFRVNNSGQQLREGMTISCKKLKAEHAEAIVIPASAVQHDSLGDFVYAVEKKKANKLYVTSGASEAGKTMIEKGLVADTQIITSGFECLSDKKNIRVVNQEQMDKEKAEALAKHKEEKAETAAVITPEPAASEKAGLFGERLRFAVHGTYYMMGSKNFKDTYVGLSGFGASIAFRFAQKMDFWVSGGIAEKKNTPAWSPEELKFRLIPLSADLRYYLLEKGKLSIFAGAGVNAFMVKDTNPVGDIKTTIIGFNATAGGYYKLSRKLFAQLFAKFNITRKDLFPDSTLDDPLDLGGLELNLGFGILL